MREFHEELRAVAREVLAPVSPLVAGGDANAPAWAQLVDMGWMGLEVPEALGGAGASFAEVAVVLEELGRVAAAGPFLGGVVLAVGALLLAEPSTERDRLLAGIADGSVRPAVALAGAGVDVEPSFRLEGGRLRGESRFIVDAPGADVVLAIADGTQLVAMTGATVSAVPVVDPSRAFGDVVADDVDATPLGAIDAGALQERAAVAVAIDSVGIAQAALDATVEYTKVRQQFGRAIGSFQAVKHQAADVAVELAVTRRLVADGTPSMAKAHATETAVQAAGTALQLHGGIGYTWEHGLHVLLKRALLNQALFGTPQQHRRLVARRYAAATRM